MEHSPLSVLIVEDNEAVRLGIREHLEAMGYFCREADHGLQALSLIKNQPVDVLLTDLNMPYMDGMQLTRTISQDRSFGSPHIVVMSAWITEDMRAKVLQSGADAILDKPFSITDLVDAIQTPHDHLPQAA